MPSRHSSYPLSARYQPFCTTDRLCVACQFCGAVTIIGGDRLRAFRKKKNFFCDIQCAGAYKKYHNKTESYRAVMHRPVSKNADAHVQAYRCKLHRGWKCCIYCGTAHSSGGHFTCGNNECQRSRDALREKLKNGRLKRFYCLECKGVYWRLTTGNPNFCSTNCSSRHMRRKTRALRRARKQSTFMEKQSLSWKDVFNKYNGICVQCGCKCTEPDNTVISRPTDATLDHILPLAKGGWHARANAQLLCFRCNSAKRDQVKTPEQLRLIIRKLNVLMAVADSLTD